MLVHQLANDHVISIFDIFVKDRVSNGEVRIEYCPTEEMWGDFFSKPLQGKLFFGFRDLIMNIDPSSLYHSSHRSVLNHESLDIPNLAVGEPTARDDDVCATRENHSIAPACLESQSGSPSDWTVVLKKVRRQTRKDGLWKSQKHGNTLE